VIVGDCDHQRRTRDDAAFEFPGKDKGCDTQHNASNQISPKEDFHGLKIGALKASANWNWRLPKAFSRALATAPRPFSMAR
jgi:hypothetical protein